MKAQRPTITDKRQIEHLHALCFTINNISERLDLDPYLVKWHLLSTGVQIPDNVTFTTDNPIYEMKFNTPYPVNDFESKHWDCHFPMFRLIFNDDYTTITKIRR